MGSLPLRRIRSERHPPRARRRHLGAALLASLVAGTLWLSPGLGGAQGGMRVSASLVGCGQDGDRVSCDLAVSFDQVADADRYTASVTKPDGTVQELGIVVPGSTTLRVGHSGNGRYVITIWAWDDGARAQSASAGG